MSSSKCKDCPYRIGYEVASLPSEDAKAAEDIINLLRKKVGGTTCSKRQPRQVTLESPKTI